MDDPESTSKILRIYNFAVIGYDIEANLTGTVAMGTIPEYEKAIARVMKQLKPSGRVFYCGWEIERSFSL